MRLIKRTQYQYVDEQTFKGRKGKFEVTISFVPRSAFHEVGVYCYLLRQKENDFVYNSLWDNHRYSTMEECANAAERKIDELKKQK